MPSSSSGQFAAAVAGRFTAVAPSLSDSSALAAGCDDRARRRKQERQARSRRAAAHQPALDGAAFLRPFFLPPGLNVETLAFNNPTEIKTAVAVARKS